MPIINLDACPACQGARIRRIKSREQSAVGGEMDWYCVDCSRVVADGGRI